MVANGTDGGVAADLVLHAEVRLIRGRPVAPSGPERLVDLRIRNGSTEVRVTGRAEHVARLQSEVWIEDQEVAVVGPRAIRGCRQRTHRVALGRQCDSCRLDIPTDRSLQRRPSRAE